LIEVRAQLNDPRTTHVFVPIADSHSICFKPLGVPKLKQRLSETKPYFVPYILIESESIPPEVAADVDILALSVLSFVDGVSSVQDICEKFPYTSAKVVMSALRLLAGLGTTALLPPVDDFSRFCLTPEASSFFAGGLTDRAEASDFCGGSSHEVSRLLAKLTGQPFPIFAETAGAVNPKKLIIFGLIKNIIRAKQLRAYCPPASINCDILKACDGKALADDVCMSLGITRPEFFTLINSTPSVSQIWS
jgi:hypothetical protein